MAHPYIPSPDVVKVQMCYTLFAQKCENVFHFKKASGPITLLDLTGLASDMVDWFDTHLKGSLSSYVTLVKIILKDMTTQQSMGIETIAGLPIAGTISGACAPSNVTVAVKWTTQFTGRSFRGRTFHVGIPITKLANNQLDNTFREGLENAYSALLSSPPEGWALGVNSEYNSNAWRTTAVFTPITNVSVDPDVDSQRRRLAGRGQ